MGNCGLRPALALALALMVAWPTLVYAEPVERRMLDLVNAERARHGLAALHHSKELAAAATEYAAAMAGGGFFSHRGPDGGTLVTRAEAAGYLGWTDLGENLAAGTTTAETVVSAWMASPSHRANVLSPLVRDVGVGYAAAPRSAFGYYWVLNLGGRAEVWLPVGEAIPLMYTPGRPSLLLATPRR